MSSAVNGRAAIYPEVNMDYISIAEASKKWGISTRRIQILCSEERIPGAERMGYCWAIPKDAQKPTDARVKSGRYIGVSQKRRGPQIDECQQESSN
jgi:hypothetical protein